jgi:HK97 family phage major capsid protein
VNQNAINARAQAIYDELSDKNKNVSSQRMKEIDAELDQLDTASRTTSKAAGYASFASPNEWNGTASPGAYNDGTPQRGQIPAWKLPEGQGSNIAQIKHHAPSPYDMAPEQLESLFYAGKSAQSFSTTVDKDGHRNKALFGGMRDKSPVGEGASGTLIPPILLPNAFTMRVEPTRIAEYFPVVEMDTGQTVTWIQHTANAVAYSALAVAESAQKPDVSPTLTPTSATYSVVAGLAKVTKQLFTDFDDVASFMPRELSNWIIQGENYQLLQGNGTAPNQIGLFSNTSTLTSQYNSTGGDTVIDTILEATTALRVGGAYAEADLILLHPTDWLAMRKLKTSFNSYILDPNDPSQLGGIDNLFGYRVVVSTEVPLHSAAVLDSKIACNVFRRWGLEIMANPYSDGAFEYNEIHYRCETRFALGVVYPEAVCLVNLVDAA